MGSAAVPYHYGADCPDALCEGIEALRPASAIVALDEAVRVHAEPLLARLRRRMRVPPFVRGRNTSSCPWWRC
ncbi:hypothetical protein B7755_006685 [Streptomyces sp. NBS 14/10]|uniref:hypothetical protein n=1 Tax=Streptomyces sp. NBS 14/10 TaxID=1945643 RepID=UPI000B7D85F6|nr:hypothetical protein [Streptomyces sp. NBS 14/10]KAK1177876.1 hypothetical protein B7755_006685 [Streptomyces sp. NBS 14/10]